MIKKSITVFLFLSLFSCSYHRYENSNLNEEYEFKSQKIITLNNPEIIDLDNDEIRVFFTLKNNSNHPIYSLDFNLLFLDKDNKVIYKKHYENGSTDLNFLKNKLFVKDNIESIKNRDEIKSFKLELLDVDFYPKYKFELSKPSPNKDLIYNDELIDINFNFNLDSISFTLKNKSNDVIEIDWNKSSLVDLNSFSDKVVNNNTKYINVEKNISNSIIAPDALYEDSIYPVKKIFYDDYRRSWKINPLFKNISYNQALLLKNHLMGVVIALKLPNNQYKNYYFKFVLKDINLE